MKTRNFTILIDTYKARLRTWRSEEIQTGAQSRAKANRLSSTEEAKEIEARRAPAGPSTYIPPFQLGRIVMRAGLLTIIGAPTALRGNQIRDLRDSQLIIHELKNVQPARCTPLAMTVTNTKTSRSSAHMENFVGIVRSSDRTACTINYLSSYKAYLHDVSWVGDSLCYSVVPKPSTKHSNPTPSFLHR